MKQIDPTSIECKTAGDAIKLLEQARQHCLTASYHPRGGQTTRRNIPIRHFVWLCGTVENYNSFRRDQRIAT